MHKGEKLTGYLTGHVYFAKRVGLRWQVWHRYTDASADPTNGASEWQACTVKYWRWINAARAANSMWMAFNAGVWCEGGRALTTQGGGDGR